jgi:hypothetical protein
MGLNATGTEYAGAVRPALADGPLAGGRERQASCGFRVAAGHAPITPPARRDKNPNMTGRYPIDTARPPA